LRSLYGLVRSHLLLPDLQADYLLEVATPSAPHQHQGHPQPLSLPRYGTSIVLPPDSTSDNPHPLPANTITASRHPM
ncbi:hypothetical protein BHE74_00054845, partial [Ensete ventricosum]